MSQSRLAYITFLDGGPVDPGYGQLPGYGGGYPSHGLPGGGNYPSQGLPGYPSHPIQPVPPGSIGQLPVFPFDPTKPDQGLPGSGEGSPDQGLPGSGGRPSHPIVIQPGMKLVVKYLACHGFIAVPDNSLPGTEPEPK
jgi:hypothetical protein